jgi:hypothetical protein
LGPARTIKAASQQLGKCKALLEKWSFTYAWAARVQAHAADIERIERLAMIEERRAAVKRHVQTAKKIQGLAARRLDDPAFKHSVKSARDVLQYAKVGQQMEADSLQLNHRDEQPLPAPQFNLMAIIQMQTAQLREKIVKDVTGRALSELPAATIAQIDALPSSQMIGNAHCTNDPKITQAPATDPPAEEPREGS